MMNEEEVKKMREEGWLLEDREDLSCPICNSKKISQINTYQTWQIINLSSGKILESHTRTNPFDRVFHSYKCRKCGWESRTFDE